MFSPQRNKQEIETQHRIQTALYVLYTLKCLREAGGAGGG